MKAGKVWPWILLVVLVVAGYFLYPVVKLAASANRQGFFEKHEERKYDVGTRANLTAIYKAIMLFHESEGHFPKSTQWMDDIKNHMQTSDMTEVEAAKKLVDPSLEGKAGAYGYAMNDAVSEKYIDDVKDKKTPLVFMSSETGRNAHGDPKKLAPTPPRGRGQFAVAVDGTIERL